MIKLNDFGRENKMYKLVPIAYNTKTYDILLTGIDDDILYFCLIHNKKYTELSDTEDILHGEKLHLMNLIFSMMYGKLKLLQGNHYCMILKICIFIYQYHNTSMILQKY